MCGGRDYAVSDGVYDWAEFIAFGWVEVDALLLNSREKSIDDNVRR